MEVRNIQIVPLTEIDQSIWVTLWQAYQAFYQVDLLEQISKNTWHKLTDSKCEHIYVWFCCTYSRSGCRHCACDRA